MVVAGQRSNYILNTMAVSESASANFALSISEKWIRQRLNLHKDSLDDVRSLSLPGSYSEKITHVGRSLLGFTRLKHLDLSRNAIESLDGLEHLKSLEILNLYYNNVSSLKELFKLGHNSKLKELDLRLNPVAKNEPDYRLFVVHMLVNLRKLDDRAVRDTERKAALVHFDTDQAYVFDSYFRGQKEDVTEERDGNHPHKHIMARTDLVKSLAPHATALEDNTDQLLQLITKSDKLHTPPALMQCHTPHYSPMEQSTTHHHLSNMNFMTPPSLRSQQSSSRQTMSQSADTTPGHFRNVTGVRYNLPKSRRCIQASLSSAHGLDVARGTRYPEDYAAFRVKGNFTPVPLSSRDSEDDLPRSSSLNALKHLLPLFQEYVEGDLAVLEQDPCFQDKFCGWYEGHALPSLSRGEMVGQVESLQRELEALQSELKSLEEQLREKDKIHVAKDKKIKELEAGQVASLQGEADAIQAELKSLEAQLREKDKLHLSKDRRIEELEEVLSQQKSESSELREQLHAEIVRREELSRSQLSVEDSQRAMQQASLELSSLQQQLQSLQDENKSLKRVLDQTPSPSLLEKSQKHISELQLEKKAMKEEMEAILDRHKQDLVNATKVQELATMLQESHRSLVATNDHLLQELEETRIRHAQEMTQMNINYDHLRKTVQLYS